MSVNSYTCGSSCSGGCSTGCAGCAAGCSNDCGGGCSTGCKSTCYGGCYDACTGCGGSCSSDCTNSCSAKCADNCSGRCSGCSGCSSCSGTCTGGCNNACKTTEAANTIAQLGGNIKQGNIIKVNDFKQLRDAMHNELSRRKKTIPNDVYTVNPALNGEILVEHSQKIFDDIKVMDVNKFKTISLGNITKAETYSEAITYIQTLMNQNIK